MAALAASSVVIIGVVEAATYLGYPVSPGLAMLLLAPCVLHLGAMKAMFTFDEKKESPPVNQGDAMAMPIFAGVALLSLYFAFKYFDMATVNMVLLAYFVVVGVGCWAGLLLPLSSLLADGKKPLFTIAAIPYVSSDPVPITPALILSTIVGILPPALYAYSKHWLSNNLLGVAFCVEGLALVDLGDFQTGATMLVGLFAYDIFMVFGTKQLAGGGPSVMEKVAVSVDGPIKLVFPLPADQALGKERPYSLLGLGDIIVPGIFLVMLLRFDAHRAKKRLAAAAGVSSGSKASPLPGSYVTPYFNAGFVAYVAGLCATLTALYMYDTAQPALLYLCPLCGIAPLLVSVVLGETNDLIAFKTEAQAQVEADAASAKGDENKEKEGKQE